MKNLPMNDDKFIAFLFLYNYFTEKIKSNCSWNTVPPKTIKIADAV